MWKLQEDVLATEDLEILTDFINNTKRFTQFEKVSAFEKVWSQWQGIDHSVYVNSGSSADLIMLDAVKEYYKLDDDAEVLVPSVTWTTNITSVIQAKMKPVFVDINLNDLAFDYDLLEKAINKNTKIILVTHLIGIPANMTKIKEIADRYKLIILEDCCESHGAVHNGDKVGNWSEASTFSFYWGHHMTTVEGGMICTKNTELRNLFLLKRSHGLARELPIEYHKEYKKKYPEIDFNFLFLTNGYNFRNTEFNAVLGINQVPKLDGYIEKRNANHVIFKEIINPIREKLYSFSDHGISSFCLPFVFKNVEDKKKFQQILTSNNIETRPIIGGNLLRQPPFEQFGNYKEFENAEIVQKNGFYIGNNQFVNEERLNLLRKLVCMAFDCKLEKKA